MAMTSREREVEEHLRAASDAILLLLGEVGQLERHKRGVQPGDTRFEELARSVREGAEALAQFTKQEEGWAKRAGVDGGVSTIERSDNAPSLAASLERWRAVERELDQAEPGSEEAAALFDQFETVRREYLEAFNARDTGD
jgi:hypothetical protein